MFEPTMEELDNIRNQREVNIAVMILLKYKETSSRMVGSFFVWGRGT